MEKLLKRLVCRLRGHRYEEFSDGCKRRCSRCPAEEWLMSNPYPQIGEPMYFWERMW